MNLNEKKIQNQQNQTKWSIFSRSSQERVPGDSARLKVRFALP